MQKSGILCFQLVESLVFGKRFDHGLKQAAKQGGTPEHVFEQEPIKEAWQLIVQELAKELEERKAVTAEPKEDDLEPQDEALKCARQPPSSFPQRRLLEIGGEPNCEDIHHSPSRAEDH